MDATTVVSGGFEWDADKAAENLSKHGVSFDEAATVFDGYTVDGADPSDPTRIITVGFAATARLLLVVSTEAAADRIRIISARKATPEERRRFIEG